MRLRFHTLDVFTQQRYGGNPLAVVLDADGLPAARMQRIAREFNLSETVFVQTPSVAGALRRLRIFTPHRELPFAGHPTVGTACLLGMLGLVRSSQFTLEEGIGELPITLRAGTPMYAEFALARPAQLRDCTLDVQTLAQVTGLIADDLGPSGWASCGVPYVLLALRRPELLAALDIDAALLARTLRDADAHGLYVYAQGYSGELRARMFWPGLGEDPATGSAAAALAAWLAVREELVQTRSWEIHQGEECGRPSRIHVEARRETDGARHIIVGGHAVPVMQGELDVD